MNLKLVRFTEYGNASLGALLVDGWPEFCTLEDRWRENEVGKSCIPEGIYEVDLYNSKRFGPTFKVLNVPDREGILFHWGNTERDTTGCILLGTRYSNSGEVAIRESMKAFTRFFEQTRQVVGKEKITLTVVSAV